MYCKINISYKYSFSIPISCVSIEIIILSHMLNSYEICFNTKPICNMLDFRYWLCASILIVLVSWYPHNVNHEQVHVKFMR